MLIAFTGPIGARTSDLSQLVADRLGWPRVKFSDHIRDVAIAQGQDPDDLAMLQTVGQALVRDNLESFVAAVLSRVEWRGQGDLVVDGLRHVEVRQEMLRQIDTTPLHVVHVEMGLTARAHNRGIEEQTLHQHDAELSEAQLKRILPQYANCSVDGLKPHGELADRIVELFTSLSPSSVAADNDEPVSLMMPFLIGEYSPRKKIPRELAEELFDKAKSLDHEVPVGLRRPLMDIVRAMNSYYSNRIEGHTSHPIDIERALAHEYSEDRDEKNLQIEAHAHIAVQEWLDAGHVSLDAVTSELVLKRLHNQFFSQLPEDFLWVEDPETHERWRVIPGEYRQRHIRVRLHVAISPGAVTRFMPQFERGYTNLGKIDRILAAAAAHHRFLWIHPFLDGNGRVARLMSDAMLRSALGSQGLWSVTRGLARKSKQYKDLLTACDLQRRNDLDGRGNLSEECLVKFTNFFLETALDQVAYMRDLIRPKRLEANIRSLVADEIAAADLPALTEQVALHLLLYGDTARARVFEIFGDASENAERALAHLIAMGLVRENENRLMLAVPNRVQQRILPNLFPDAD